MVRLPPTCSNSCSCKTRSRRDLDGGRKVGDFVQEERAAFGLLDAAGAAERGAGEGALFVAEELALQQPVAERGAVYLHERLAGAEAVVVNGRGDKLLAGARLAADEDRRAGRGDLVDTEVDLAHAVRVADDALRAEPLLEGVAEPQVFRFEQLPLRLFHVAAT